MVKREANNNAGNEWAVWCNHVLLELERLDRESAIAKRRAFNAWVLAMIIQAQLFIGGVGLGYLIKAFIDHVSTKG